jgi:hypothetical protein
MRGRAIACLFGARLSVVRFPAGEAVFFTFRQWHIAFVSLRCTGSSMSTPNKLGKAVETEQRRAAVCAWLAMESSPI